MIEFKKCLLRNYPYLGYGHEWISSVYNQYFGDKKDGFLVEIGVGHVIDWSLMPIEKQTLARDDYKYIVRGESTTIELLEHGWSGIYIEPIEEFLFNELYPLLTTILKPEQLEKISMVPVAASDSNYITKIVAEETLGTEHIKNLNNNNILYQYQNRTVQCRKTSEILIENNCPSTIDLMSIDAEGYELNVINGIDFNIHKPLMIIAETNKVYPEKILGVLPNEYRILCGDNLNTVFING